jgi:hypothetical protein
VRRAGASSEAASPTALHQAANRNALSRRLPARSRAGHSSLERSEEVIQADLEGLNTAKFVAKAELRTRHCSSSRSCKSASRQRFVVSEADEHVFALYTPAVCKCPFQTAADRISCEGVATRGRNDTIVASSCDRET